MRNSAIVAPVKHGKTTMVDAMLWQSGRSGPTCWLGAQNSQICTPQCFMPGCMSLRPNGGSARDLAPKDSPNVTAPVSKLRRCPDGAAPWAGHRGGSVAAAGQGGGDGRPANIA